MAHVMPYLMRLRTGVRFAKWFLSQVQDVFTFSLCSQPRVHSEVQAGRRLLFDVQFHQDWPCLLLQAVRTVSKRVPCESNICNSYNSNILNHREIDRLP